MFVLLLNEMCRREKLPLPTPTPPVVTCMGGSLVFFICCKCKTVFLFKRKPGFNLSSCNRHYTMSEMETRSFTDLNTPADPKILKIVHFVHARLWCHNKNRRVIYTLRFNIIVWLQWSSVADYIMTVCVKIVVIYVIVCKIKDPAVFSVLPKANFACYYLTDDQVDTKRAQAI